MPEPAAWPADRRITITDLQAATGILVRFYWLLFLLPLIVLGAWRYWPNRHQRGVAALLAGLAVLVGSQAVVRAILYLPILELGK